MLERAGLGGLDMGTRFGARPLSGLRRWEPEEDDLVRQLHAEGLTRRQAHRRFNEAPSPFDDRSLDAISRRADKLGLQFIDRAPRAWDSPDYLGWTEARLELTKKLWKAGWSAAKIATELGHGLTKNAVIGKLARLKLLKHSRPDRIAKRAERLNKKRLAQLKRARAKVKTKLKKPGRISVELAGTRGWFSPPRDPKFPKAPATDVARIKHEELGHEHCRWPVGDPAQVAIHREPFFCGAQREEGLPYCREHCRRAFTVVPLFPHHVYPTPGIA